MSLEETSNHVNSQDLQWTAVTAVILLKFSCWPRRLLHPLSQHHCRSSNQGRTCPPDQRRWWWTGTPWSNWVNLHQVSLGICAFRHLHNNDNAHSFSLRSSARELQGHCRGIVPALQGRCKEYRRANKGQHLPSWQAQVPCSSRLQPWHQTKPETSCCSWQGRVAKGAMSRNWGFKRLRRARTVRQGQHTTTAALVEFSSCSVFNS